MHLGSVSSESFMSDTRHGGVASGTTQVYRLQVNETIPLGRGAGMHRTERTLMASGRRVVHVSILAGGQF